MKLATIEKITTLTKHPNADSLSIAQVLGWQSIVKTGEFKENEKIVFIVIDTVLPKAPWSKFLEDPKKADKPKRLNTEKLRGLPSQGLILPLGVLTENDPTIKPEELAVGTDVTEILKVEKYEKPIPLGMAGQIKGNFPLHLIHTTDEDNGLSNLDIVEDVLVKQQSDICITQKLNGSSCTIVIEEGEIQEVCSRKLSIKESEENAFWKVAKKLTIPPMWSGIVQGELCGPGINGNDLKLKEPTLYVFQIKTNMGFLFYNVMEYVCNKVLHCNIVPLVYQGPPKTLQEIIDIADKQTISTPEGPKPAEGVVVRPWHYPAHGIGRPVGFKIINRNFKEKQ